MVNFKDPFIAQLFRWLIIRLRNPFIFPHNRFINTPPTYIFRVWSSAFVMMISGPGAVNIGRFFIKKEIQIRENVSLASKLGEVISEWYNLWIITRSTSYLVCDKFGGISKRAIDLFVDPTGGLTFPVWGKSLEIICTRNLLNVKNCLASISSRPLFSHTTHKAFDLNMQLNRWLR